MIVTTGERGDQIFRVVIVFFFFHFRGIVDADEFHRIAEFAGYQLDDVGFQALVDGNHHPEAHTFADDFGIAHVHQVSQFADADEFGYLEPAVEHFFVAGLFGHFFAFGAAIFGFEAFAAAARSGQFGLGLADLFLDLFFIDLLGFAGCMPAVAAAVAATGLASCTCGPAAGIPLDGDTALAGWSWVTGTAVLARPP